MLGRRPREDRAGRSSTPSGVPFGFERCDLVQSAIFVDRFAIIRSFGHSVTIVHSVAVPTRAERGRKFAFRRQFRAACPRSCRMLSSDPSSSSIGSPSSAPFGRGVATVCFVPAPARAERGRKISFRDCTRRPKTPLSNSMRRSTSTTRAERRKSGCVFKRQAAGASPRARPSACPLMYHG